MTITPKLSEAQFSYIARQIDASGTELVVCDFNGVLDDYYGTKYEFIDEVLGDQHRQHHFGRLALLTDTAYVTDRSATLERTITDYYADNGIGMDARAKATLEAGPRRPVITPEAKAFLGNLAMPAVIFTAQSSDRLYQSVEADFLGDLGIGAVTSVRKPSVDALSEVLSSRNITAEAACMIGDGLIDDILPARLLGMRTILVSPFVDTHASL